MRALDFSACSGLRADEDLWLISHDVTELSLPRAGFERLALTFLRRMKVEVLNANVDDEITRLLPQLSRLGVRKLTFVSSKRQEPFHWSARVYSEIPTLTNPQWIDARANVVLTVWPEVRFWRDLRWIRALDLGGLPGATLPPAASFEGLVHLVSVVLPAALRALPHSVFKDCSNLEFVDSANCFQLETIAPSAFGACRALRDLALPASILEVRHWAFGGTAIRSFDLSHTKARSVAFAGMNFLESLILPRGCVLRDLRGVTALKHLTLSEADDGDRASFGGRPETVKFESMCSPPGPLVATCSAARVFAELGAVADREATPFSPP
jgi:hypothetical protein